MILSHRQAELWPEPPHCCPVGRSPEYPWGPEPHHKHICLIWKLQPHPVDRRRRNHIHLIEYRSVLPIVWRKGSDISQRKALPYQMFLPEYDVPAWHKRCATYHLQDLESPGKSRTGHSGHHYLIWISRKNDQIPCRGP